MNVSLSRTAVRIALATLAVLVIPLAAMVFTKEVSWGLEDFAAAGILLFVSGVTYAILERRLQRTVQRVAVAAAIVVVLGAVWAQLAVGLFT